MNIKFETEAYNLYSTSTRILGKQKKKKDSCVVHENAHNIMKLNEMTFTE